MSTSLAERLLATLPKAIGHDDQIARTAFLAAGLPDRHVESWRYSSLAGLASLDTAAGYAAAFSLPALAGLSGTLVERRSGAHSVSADLPSGVAVTVRAASGDLSPTEGGRGPILPTAAQAFDWLAQTAVSEILDIDVSAPVAGVWRLALQQDALGFEQSRARISVRSGAAITLLEHVYGGDEATGLSNRSLDIELESGASLTLIRVQESGAKAHLIQRTSARVATGAGLNMVSLELGGLWSRHELAVDLVGVGAEVRLNGLVALQGRQHHDTQLSLTHAVAAAHSRTLWKAIANGRSRSVFNGLIAVAPGADQTEAHLKTANLLLSPHAEIDTKPELIIEADEVVCSHGATVGQLDDKALFYLRSRGLPEAQARQMLTLAFGGEVLAAVAPEDLRAGLAERVSSHMPQSQ